MRPIALLLTGLLASGAAFASDANDNKLGGKSTPAQVFSIDGVLYGCTPGSQAKGVALDKCTKLPTNVSNMINASGATVPQLSTNAGSSTTSSSSTSGTSDGDSADITVVGTPQGPKSCPTTAFTSNNQLDLTQCTDAAKGKKVHAVCLSPSTTGSTTTTSTSGTASTTSGSTTTAADTTVAPTTSTGSSTLLTCTMPGATQSKNPLPKFGTVCPGGGTNQVTGGYDPTSGKIDITITFTACIDERGVSHDGTAIMQGTLTADSTGTNLYQLDETKTINSTLTFPTGGNMTRSCTVMRKGAYNNASGDFTGTISRTNCTMTGAYRFKKGLVDNLIENAAEAEPI